MNLLLMQSNSTGTIYFYNIGTLTMGTVNANVTKD